MASHLRRVSSRSSRVTGVQLSALPLQAEDGIRDWSVTGVQTCALLIQAEDGIRDWSVTGVQTCALLFQAEDGIRDWSVTGVQTCALPICKRAIDIFIYCQAGRGHSFLTPLILS